jgi:hypothetical protein
VDRSIFFEGTNTHKEWLKNRIPNFTNSSTLRESLPVISAEAKGR